MNIRLWLRSHAALVAVLVAAIVAIGVVVGAGIVPGTAASSASAPTSPAPSATASTAPPVGAASGMQDPVTGGTAVKEPPGTTAVRVQIPAIGVDSGLEQLSLDASGTLLPPTAWQSAGWYSGGVLPGEVGPAVIAGHIDSTTGPAVFVHLGQLHAGDEILVTLSTQDVEKFRVTSMERAPKAAFPAASVYGPVPAPELRLITCDGVFDSSTGHYTDNLIVFASKVDA